MKIVSDYERLFTNLEEMYPNIAEDAISAYQSGDMELTVRTSDGSKYIYNDFRKTFRRIRPHSSDGATNGYLSEEDWKYEFHIALKRKLDNRMMSQKELSERTGISPVMISHYINGRSAPSVYNVSLISNALECSISELVDFDF